ncbi:hypothetical protein QBC42DRAFT_317621 [Cladorrhinum samala]|uniref:Uncharacterized protein n=1 Tax=Cladorrhinum samala TaxID=585594 RepID=A0AAV9HXJ7_9PEZI|nr:hypothetical protein QBC42DRAFT_317621 [Cladorrhinum samala]
MFENENKKHSTQPQATQSTTVQRNGESQQVVEVLVQRTTWEKVVTTTSKTASKTAKTIRKVTPAAIKPKQKSTPTTPGMGSNQVFYRASYLSLTPAQQYDLFHAGLAPHGVPVPPKPLGWMPSTKSTYKPKVEVMYLTQPNPQGQKAGQLTILPRPATANKKKVVVKKTTANPDALPSFPTPTEGVKLVHRPAQPKPQQQQQQGRRQQQTNQLQVQGHGNPVKQQVAVVPQDQRQQHQQQQQLVTVTLPAAQQVESAHQRQQGQAVQVVQRPPPQQQVVRTVRYQQQQQQQQPQQQYLTITVPVQVRRVQSQQQQQQQQQQQRVQVQTVRVQQPPQQRQQRQQQYVVVQESQHGQQSHQVRQSQQVLLVPGQARPRAASSPGVGRRTPGQSVVVLRTQS